MKLYTKFFSHSQGQSKNLQSIQRLNKEYFQGLNYLIENQTDKAIDEFVKLLEVDNETIEIHLTLASLFRSRGEVDRAIRIHQNIIARPNLAPFERLHALSELGRDYLQAGVLDRAENLFLEVVAKPGPQKQACLEFLLCIYEQEKDWLKAIQTAKKCQSSQSKSMAKVIAQYYCELAHACADAQPKDTIKYLVSALKANPLCVRANLMLGNLYARMGQCKLAIKYLDQVGRQDARWLGETVENLYLCYLELKKEKQLIHYWESSLDKSSNIAIVIGLAKILRHYHGDRKAIDFLALHMRRSPSLLILASLVDIYAQNSEGDALEKLILLQGFIDALLKKSPPYCCQSCGFSGFSLYWQCPGCRSWEVVLPSQWGETNSFLDPLEGVNSA